MATTGSPLSAAASQRDLHFREMKEGLQNQEVDAGVLEQADLLGDVVARLAERRPCPSRSTSCVRETLPATSAWSPATSLASFTAAELIASVCGAVAGAAQLLARAEKRERLQHLRAGAEKLAVQLAQRVGMLDRDLRRELPAAAAGADLLAARAAVDVAAALQFDQIAAVADDGALSGDSSVIGFMRMRPRLPVIGSAVSGG